MARPVAVPTRGDVSAKRVAALMGMSEVEFRAAYPSLIERGFPEHDPDTNNFCIEAVDRWRLLRHQGLFPDMQSVDKLTGKAGAKNAVLKHAQLKAADNGNG